MARTNAIAVSDEVTETIASREDPTAAYLPKTELGRRLMAYRAEIVRSGIPLLDWDELEREIAERRGGVALHEFEDRGRS